MRLLVLPATIVTAAMLLGPVLLMLRISLNRYDPFVLMESALSLENYASAVSDAYYQEIMLRTLAVSSVSTVLTLMIAFPVAYWLARLESRWKGALIVATLLPLLVGNVVRIGGWIAILGTEGAVNATLQGAGLTQGPVQLLYTPSAVIVGSVSVLLPYMIIVVSAVIENIPKDVEDAARNLGAPWWRVFGRIVLPMAAPGVLAGSVLVFVLCMNAYATPVLLGGPRFTMMAPAVYEQYMRATNWPFGSALAFLLLFSTVALVAATSLAVGSRAAARQATQ